MGISIIGSGVVGQATGKGFIKAGQNVTFFDIKKTTLDNLQKEGYTTAHIDDIEKFENDVTIICLPTPFDNGKVDLSYFENAIPYVANKLKSSKNYHLIIVRSTVPPGTSKNIIIPLIESYSGKKSGYDFGFCMNPEFLRQKTAQLDFLKPWSIVIGALDKKSGDLVETLYKYFIEKEKPSVLITDLDMAEMIKYAQNLYNAAKISFTNEIWRVSKQIGLDGDIVMAAVADSAEGMWNPAYGVKGGFPYDGHCLPKDTQGFLAFAKDNLKTEMPLLQAIIAVNESIKQMNSTGR